jgi:hypothetical protein
LNPNGKNYGRRPSNLLPAFHPRCLAGEALAHVGIGPLHRPIKIMRHVFEISRGIGAYMRVRV